MEAWNWLLSGAPKVDTKDAAARLREILAQKGTGAKADPLEVGLFYEWMHAKVLENVQRMQQAGRQAELVPLLEKAVGRYAEFYGDKSFALFELLRQLSSALFRLGKHAEETKVQARMEQLCQRSDAPSGPAAVGCPAAFKASMRQKADREEMATRLRCLGRRASDHHAKGETQQAKQCVEQFLFACKNAIRQGELRDDPSFKFVAARAFSHFADTFLSYPDAISPDELVEQLDKCQAIFSEREGTSELVKTEAHCMAGRVWASVRRNLDDAVRRFEIAKLGFAKAWPVEAAHIQLEQANCLLILADQTEPLQSAASLYQRAVKILQHHVSEMEHTKLFGPSLTKNEQLTAALLHLEIAWAHASQIRRCLLLRLAGRQGEEGKEPAQFDPAHLLKRGRKNLEKCFSMLQRCGVDLPPAAYQVEWQLWRYWPGPEACSAEASIEMLQQLISAYESEWKEDADCSEALHSARAHRLDEIRKFIEVERRLAESEAVTL